MLHFTIPGYGSFRIQHFVMDFNGTLAVDGHLLNGVAERFQKLSPEVDLYVLTADTFGLVRQEMGNMPCTVTILGKEHQAEAKGMYVEKLGAESTVAFGNGRNDRLMLKKARLGIAILQGEGVARETWDAADIVVKHIHDALDLFLNEKRLIATLRR